MNFRELGKISNAGYGAMRFELLEGSWTEEGIEFLVDIELENGIEIKDAKIKVDTFQLEEWEINESEDEYAILRIALGLNEV